MAKQRRNILTRMEVAKYLGIEDRTLRRMIEAGEFPRPFPLTRGTWVWKRKEVKAFVILQGIRDRFRASGDSPEPDNHRPTVGQSRTTAKRGD